MEGLGSVSLLLLLAVSGLGRQAVRADNPICLLPVETGYCEAYMFYYFYNSTSQQCEVFVYDGCGGNANRFKTLTDCREACIPDNPICRLSRKTGPCKSFFPMYFFNPTSQQCEVFIYGGCNGNANRFITEVECKRTCKAGDSPNVETVVKPRSAAENPSCLLPRDPGPCYAHKPRYYYNPTSQQCVRFIYGGCGGNANRFESAARCEQTCIAGASANVQAVAKPRLDNPICRLPPESGLCKAYMPSYFFNPTSLQCERFIYGGCGGNANRFRNLVECKQACIAGDSPNVETVVKPRSAAENPSCLLPREPGPCYAHKPSYYYNSTSQQCERFIYGGCGGNANRFENAAKCEQACNAEVVCQQSPEKGPCRARIASFFFNSTSGQCEPFIYGGCRGNANRFPRKSRCMAVCLKDTSEVSPEEDNPWTYFPQYLVAVKRRSASSDGDRAMPGSSDD